MLLLTLALGWTLYACAKQLGGAWGGVLCLSVYVSMPAFLTFGPLVHTDVAVALFSLLALWTFAQVWREPSRKNALLFGLSLAGALLSKFTAGVLFFAFVAFALSLRWRAVLEQPKDKAAAREWRQARLGANLKGGLWAGLAGDRVYFVFSWQQPPRGLHRCGAVPTALILCRVLLPP